MKKAIIGISTAMLLVSGLAYAQTTDASDLPAPGILPGNPLYFVESFFEKVGDVLTFGEEAKARRAVRIAEKRLAEAEVLAEQGDENTDRALNMYEGKLQEALRRARASGNEEILDRITEATSKHADVLERNLDRVPEQAQEAIRNAIERSRERHLDALRTLVDRNPERLVDVVERTNADLTDEERNKRTQVLEGLRARSLEDALPSIDRAIEVYRRHLLPRDGNTTDTIRNSRVDNTSGEERGDNVEPSLQPDATDRVLPRTNVRPLEVKSLNTRPVDIRAKDATDNSI